MFTRLSDIVPKLINKHNLNTAANAAQVLNRLPQALDAISATGLLSKVKALYLKDNILYLQVPNNAVAQEIQLNKTTFLKIINRGFSESRVKDLRFRVNKQG